MLINKIYNVDSNINIENIMYDSRLKLKNSIFFAIKGKLNDGHNFINTAIENGAICIVHTDDIENKKENILYIKVSDATKSYIDFCHAFYDYPFNKLKCFGITGTNGKTTISWIIRNLIAKFEKCGYIGTMGYYYGEEIKTSSLNLTTPKPDELYRIAKEMVDYGCKNLVMETSSEGLLTHRLDSIDFKAAVFNNLSREHFNIHGDMESYFKAKCILFDNLKDDAVAIINIDDEYGKRLYDNHLNKKVSYGIENICDYQAINIELFNDHTKFDLLHNNNIYHINTNIVAKFNIYNLLAVIALLNENGYEIEKIINYLNEIQLCPGRCQLINCGQDFNVVVDYAFTPNSFDKIFNYANSITSKDKKIMAVFGAAGDRDHGRRPGSVAIADKYCSYVVLSYDDPATEDMLDICNDLKSMFKNITPDIELDRYKAIKMVIDKANKGDTILLLGKGNDDFFLDKNGRIPWMSDEVAANRLIKEKLNNR